MSDTAPAPSPGLSRTSIFVAAGRAVGAREPDTAARNPDHLAERLLGDPASFDIDMPIVRALSVGYDEALKDAEVVSNVRMMAVRTRFIDDALTRAVHGGVTQVVILGAGFDSHAYRFQELLSDVRVFEVDRAATQAYKRQRVDEVLGGPPANLTYVPVDFQRDDLREVLTRHGYDPAQRTFFILEGVTMYVPEAGIRTTFQFVGAHPPGSVIVFDFVYRAMIEMLAKIDLANIPAPAKPFVQRFLDLIRDEPWVFGVPVGGEQAFLAEFGLELRELLTIGSEEAVKRYATKSDGTAIGAAAMAEAMARMAAAQHQAAGQASATPDPETLARTREQQRVMGYQLAEAVVRPPA
jgi:methyltransferase (TIGR00027 family)